MKINYPSEQWLANYMGAHKCDKDTAEMAWWDNEIDHDRPTPFDLPDEQQKVVKEFTRGNSTKERKPTERKRKPDEEKRQIIARIAEALADLAPTVSNPERQIDFGAYTLTLTKHRPPKA